MLRMRMLMSRGCPNTSLQHVLVALQAGCIRDARVCQPRVNSPSVGMCSMICRILDLEVCFGEGLRGCLDGLCVKTLCDCAFVGSSVLTILAVVIAC